MGDWKSLRVWREAHQLTPAVYAATAAFPKAELYGLTSQIRRAAASVPATIAEGCGRNGDTELARFCRIALGSANELEYHLLLARPAPAARSQTRPFVHRHHQAEMHARILAHHAIRPTRGPIADSR